MRIVRSGYAGKVWNQISYPVGDVMEASLPNVQKDPAYLLSRQAAAATHYCGNPSGTLAIHFVPRSIIPVTLRKYGELRQVQHFMIMKS